VPVDLLFTDLHLPGHAEGLSVAALAKDLHSGIEIIVTSSRLREDDAPAVERLGTFVAKPYLISRVLMLIEPGCQGGPRAGARSRLNRARLQASVSTRSLAPNPCPVRRRALERIVRDPEPHRPIPG